MTVVLVVLAIAAAAGAVVALTKRRNALPRSKVASIDPFTVGEPWRRHVSAAQSSLRRYREIVKATPSGPLRERLTMIATQVEHGVDECWQVAKRGDELDGALRRLDAPSLQNQLQRANASGDTATATSLQAQIDSANRIRSTRDDADQQLRHTTTRLGELLAQASEVSIGGDTTEQLGTAVDDVVTQLESLRLAVQDVNAIGRGPEPGQTAPSS